MSIAAMEADQAGRHAPNKHGERTILCVDMDAFFASVEQKTNPRLKGKPIAVIGSSGRTVVTTASYEARAFGVKTGMNVWEARQCCPRLIFVVGNNERYTHTCAELAKIYAQYTPEMEVYSVDEAFMDITDTHHLFGGPLAIGAAIKAAIKERFGINGTVGIGPNILMAKLASDISKPDGLRQLLPEELPELLEPMPVGELWGIGSKTTERLAALGIRTCGELGRAPASLLRNKFGIMGELLREMGQGICRRPVKASDEEEPVKSVGHSMTLPKDIWDRAEIEAHLLKLSEMVGRRARRYGLMGRRVTLTLRYTDFETISRQETLPCHTNDTHEIYEAALRIMTSFRLKDKVRLLGVSISSVLEDMGQELLIEAERRRKRLLVAMDSVNEKYGDFKLTWGAYMGQRREPDVISPAWRPSGVRNVNVR